MIKVYFYIGVREWMDDLHVYYWPVSASSFSLSALTPRPHNPHTSISAEEGIIIIIFCLMSDFSLDSVSHEVRQMTDKWPVLPFSKNI